MKKFKKSSAKEPEKEVLRSAEDDVEMAIASPTTDDEKHNDAEAENVHDSDSSVAGKKNIKQLVSASQYSNSSANAKYPTAREISETFQTKFKEMTAIFISIFVNAGLIVFFYSLQGGKDSIH
jgi:hypothetical protein